MKKIITISTLSVVLIASLAWAVPYFSTPASMPQIELPVSKKLNVQQRKEKSAPTLKAASIQQIENIDVSKLMKLAKDKGLNPRALKAALNAYSWAHKKNKLGKNESVLTVVDFSQPSYKKRLWVLDLNNNKVLMNTYTSQGSKSGQVYAKSFSNRNNSRKSSLGIFKTSEQYYGSHGKSMRVDGLQKGYNTNARRRNITIHPAYYASEQFVKANHRAGRSWGCFTIDPALKNKFLGYIKGGSAVFAYAAAIEKSPIVRNGPLTI